MRDIVDKFWIRFTVLFTYLKSSSIVIFVYCKLLLTADNMLNADTADAMLTADTCVNMG